MEYAIETINLTKKFSVGSRVTRLMGRGKKGRYNPQGHSSSEIAALDNVNLRIERGEFVGLLGPNGAGKTTLIKTLCTLIIPTSGTAIVNGYDVVKESARVRSSVALVQSGERSFYWRLSGRQNLEFFASLYNISRSVRARAVQDSLDLVGLDEWADEKVMKYSTGMRQRLSLARGLLLDTPIFLMDEPTLGLDVHASLKMRDFVKNLSEEREKTILYATHYIHEAEKLCEKVAIIHNGQIIALDSPTELKERFGEDKVIELEVSDMSPAMVERIRSIERVKKAAFVMTKKEVGLGRIRIHTSDSRSILPEVLDTIDGMNGKVEYVRTKEATLEDVFISLTGVSLEADQARIRPVPYARRGRFHGR